MPTVHTKIEVGFNCVKEDGSHRKAVSNFSLQILGLVNVAPDAGGSELLLLVKDIQMILKSMYFWTWCVQYSY